MLLCTHFLGRYGHETSHSPPGCIRIAFGGPEQCDGGLGVPHEFDSSEKFILVKNSFLHGACCHARMGLGSAVFVVQAASWVYGLQKKPSGRSVGAVVHSGCMWFTWCGAVGRWTEGEHMHPE